MLGRIAQKLLDAIAQPFKIEEHDIYVTSSIGISVYPDDSDDPEELLKHADVAMYRSKELGRNTYQFLDADLAQRRLKQHTLESALRSALKDGPAAAALPAGRPDRRPRGRRRRGAAALERSRARQRPAAGVHPAGRGIGPHPRARRMGAASRPPSSASRGARRGMPLTVSVNLSARQFYREDLAQRISDIVRGVGCEPSWIELEVTETSLLHDLDAIRKVLHQLRNEGFTVAIDDFGTGYSSLTHLKHFPIDTLKIDISFIADLETDPGDAAITEAIIGLARGLEPQGRRRRRGHAGAARFPARARLPLLPGLLGQQAAARPTDFAALVALEVTLARLSGDRARATRRGRVSYSVCEPARELARRLLPLPLEHHHVREPRQDRRVDAVVARGGAHVVRRRRCDRPRRPARRAARRRAPAAASAGAATGRAARAATRCRGGASPRPGSRASTSSLK